MTTLFYWHIHHNELVEAATKPIENRERFIKRHKAPEEVELRLRLLKPVCGKLPAAVIQAGEDFVKTREDYNSTWETYLGTKTRSGFTSNSEQWNAYERAGRAFSSAMSAYYRLTQIHHRVEIEALHAKECPDCSWDGKTIFPESNTK